MNAEKVFLSVHRHSDLVWRRTQAGYEEVREKQILQMLSLFEKYPEYRFCFAQTEILKAFIELHPEFEDTIAKLIKAKRIELSGGLVSIPDTNMVTGESLIRNFMTGLSFCQKHYQVTPRIAWLMDCFGMSGQLPQILMKMGFRYLYPGRMPGLPQAGEYDYRRGFIWEGLDGSSVIVASESESIDPESYTANLPVIYNMEERVKDVLTKTQQYSGNVFAMYNREEDLICEKVLSMIDEFNKSANKKIVFAQPSDYFNQLDRNKLPAIKGEFNPTFTGCYSSLIRVKQLCREVENLLISTEKLCSVTGMTLNFKYPKEIIDAAWYKLFIAQFHDGICGCHVESVYNELLEELVDVKIKTHRLASSTLQQTGDVALPGKTGLLLFNPLTYISPRMITVDSKSEIAIFDENNKAIPVQRDGDKICFTSQLPEVGFKFLRTEPYHISNAKIINDFSRKKDYLLQTDNFSIKINGSRLEIQPRFQGGNIFANNFGEILFRHDEGTLWREKFTGPYYGEKYQEEYLSRIEEGNVFTKIVFKGHVLPNKPGFGNFNYWHGFGSLTWKKEFIFPRETTYFKLRLTLDWEGQNTKVFLSFPLNINPDEAAACYEIPFGCTKRNPYFEVPVKYRRTLKELPGGGYKTALGDWPALNWVDYSDRKNAIAIANNGTPGHQMVGDRIIVSILRSPTEKASNFFPGGSSAENRTHVYEFDFLPHEADDLSQAIELGMALNNPAMYQEISGFNSAQPVKGNPLTKPIISISPSNIVLSALKMAEGGNGWIVRMYEGVGKATDAELKVNFDAFKLYETDLNENNNKIVSEGKITFKPFEIKTFLIET